MNVMPAGSSRRARSYCAKTAGIPAAEHSSAVWNPPTPGPMTRACPAVSEASMLASTAPEQPAVCR